MMKRYIWLILLIVGAMALYSCAPTTPDVTPWLDATPFGTPEGPLLVLPNPTITATVTRVGWKPATYVAPGADPYHPSSLGVCQSDNVRTTGQNWSYVSYGWGDFEPTRGGYDFAFFDDVLAGLDAHDTVMFKIIVNSPGANYGDFHYIPEWAYDSIYLLPDTEKSTIVAYTLLPETTRVVCSPYNRANYADLTALQKANFDTYCRYSTRASGWDPQFLEYYSDMMQAIANRYDNDPRVSGYTIHGGGDYGEAGLMYGCLSATECPTGTGVLDANDSGNTYVRTMAEIYGVSAADMATSCRPDDEAGTFNSIYYENAGYTYSSCWGRYYAYSIKRIIDTAKEHWRATPLVFSMGSGIISSVGYISTYDVGVSFDTLSYALHCYGNYSVYGKQDGWKYPSAWYLPMYWFTTDAQPVGLTSTLGRTITSLEHGDDSYWQTDEQHITNLTNAHSAKVMFPCIGNGIFHQTLIDDGTYNTYSANFLSNFNTYAKPYLYNYVAPAPVSCLGGISYPTPTATITPGGPTLTPTFTAIPPTATSTPGGPTNTPTVTSTPVPGASSVTIYPSQDSWMSVTAPTYNWGTYTTMSIRHAGNSRPILQFDLGSVPAGASITSAELKYTISSWDYGVEVKTFSIYTVTASWTETGVTWNSRNGADNWGTGGGDYSGSMGLASVSGAGQKSFSSAALLDVVQRWKAGTLANNGMLFRSDESVFQSAIWSRESTQKPELIVYYLLPTPTATVPTATVTSTPLAATPFAVEYDTYLRAGFPDTNYVNAVIVRADQPEDFSALLRFDLSAIPAGSTINQALLYMYTVARDAAYTAELGAHRVISDVVYSQTTYNIALTGVSWEVAGAKGSADRVDTPENTTSVSALDTWYTWSIPVMVKAWIDGSSTNNGVIIEDDGGGDSVRYDFHSLENVTDATLVPMLHINYSTPTPTITPTPTDTVAPTSTATWTPTDTPLPTATPTATATPAGQFFINEVMPAPTSIDWNIDGQYNTRDQWVELFNGFTSAQNIAGYHLTITGSVAAYTYTLPSALTIGSWSYLIVWPWAQAGTVLSDTTYITLYNSSLVEVDAVTVPGATPDWAYLRMPDSGSWQWWRWPSFGRPNAQATPTVTATITPTRTATPT